MPDSMRPRIMDAPVQIQQSEPIKTAPTSDEVKDDEVRKKIKEKVSQAEKKTYRSSRHNLFMTPELHERIRNQAREAGIPVNEYLNRVLEAVV